MLISAFSRAAEAVLSRGRVWTFQDDISYEIRR